MRVWQKRLIPKIMNRENCQIEVEKGVKKIGENYKVPQVWQTGQKNG